MTQPDPPSVMAATSLARPMGRRLALAAVALTAAGAGAWHAARRHQLSEPELTSFWEHSFPAPDGTTLALASLRGRPLLVNFWATWCPPCVEELPLLSRFYTDNRASGWQLLGLAVDQVAPVQRFLARAPVSFPVAMAGLAGVDLTRALGNAGGGLPFTVVFDAEGTLRHRKIGQLQPADLAAWRG